MYHLHRMFVLNNISHMSQNMNLHDDETDFIMIFLPERMLYTERWCLCFDVFATHSF